MRNLFYVTEIPNPNVLSPAGAERKAKQLLQEEEPGGEKRVLLRPAAAALPRNGDGTPTLYTCSEAL